MIWSNILERKSRFSLTVVAVYCVILISGCNGSGNQGKEDGGLDAGSDASDAAGDAGGDSDADSDTDADGDSDGDMDSDGDADADGDADMDANADADADGHTDTPCTDDGQCTSEGMICNENWGICVAPSCNGQGDFTPCEIVTSPDRSYDICVDEVCVSPGCGEATCNVPGPHFPLADSNQRTCYDRTMPIPCTPFPCNSDGSPEYCGQDAQYGWDTKHTEEERFARDTSIAANPVVKDKVTGLEWQGCAAGLSGASCDVIDDADAGAARTYTWDEALAYCDSLDWGGHKDWRLPDPYELDSILDANWMAPWINHVAFPGTPDDYFWSSSLSATSASYAWSVGFGNTVMYGIKRVSVYYVRCIRGGPMKSRQLKPSILSGDRVVEDTATGLMWQGCTAGKHGASCDENDADAGGPHVWKSALAYCEGLSWAGHDDWRLPNRKELFSIVDDRRTAPAMDIVAFPGAPPAGSFLSSTGDAYFPIETWTISIEDGSVWEYLKDSIGSVLCVRDGP